MEFDGAIKDSAKSFRIPGLEFARKFILGQFEIGPRDVGETVMRRIGAGMAERRT